MFWVDITVGENTQVIPVIPILVVGGRLLIAVPRSWHRSPSQRVLPAGALVKPALAVVAGVFPGNPPSLATPEWRVKVSAARSPGQGRGCLRAAFQRLTASRTSRRGEPGKDRVPEPGAQLNEWLDITVAGEDLNGPSEDIAPLSRTSTYTLFGMPT